MADHIALVLPLPERPAQQIVNGLAGKWAKRDCRWTICPPDGGTTMALSFLESFVIKRHEEIYFDRHYGRCLR